MTAPARIQLSRAKGSRKPDGAVVVARPTKWGNPFPWQGSWIVWLAVGLGYHADEAGRRAAAVSLYRSWLTGEPAVALDDDPNEADRRGLALGAALLETPPAIPEPPSLGPLRGKNLACWCPLDQPCHADVLLEIANV